MKSPEQESRLDLTPGLATQLGFGLGVILAVAASLNPPSGFTVRFLLILLSSLGPCGGIAGYLLWLVRDPARFERFQKIIGIAGLCSVVGLLVGFPLFWREVGRSMGPHMIFMFLAGTFSAVAFAVAGLWGMIHFLHHLMNSTRPVGKPSGNPREDGLWDRELDRA